MQVGKTIKQPDTWSCVLCCVQMATRLPRQELLKAIGRTDKRNYKSGLEVERFVPIMYKCGLYLGATYIDFDSGYNHSYLDEIHTVIYVEGFPAFVTVNSERFPGKLHLVFWDGYNIRDPNPDKPEITTFSDYTIRGWSRLTFEKHKLLTNLLEYYSHEKHKTEAV